MERGREEEGVRKRRRDRNHVVSQKECSKLRLRTMKTKRSKII